MKKTSRRLLYVFAILLGALFIAAALAGFAACGGGSSSGNNSGDAHQHSYTRSEVAATCEVAGKITYTCSCGDSFSETTQPLGHDYTTGGEHVDATCVRAGYTVLTCQREGCDATRTISGEAATGIHDYVSSVVTAATCVSAGTMTYTCSVCENSFDETIDALGHDVAVGEDGVYRCKREGCGQTFTEAEMIHHHDYELISQDEDEGYTAATCTTDGVGTYKCNTCGYVLSDATIPATGHSFGEADENGWYTCSNCGGTFNTGVDGASHDHAYTDEAYFCSETGEWIVTCTASGCSAAKVLDDGEKMEHTLLVYCADALGEVEDPDHGTVYGEFTAYGYYREVTDGNYKLMADIDSEIKIVRGERVTIDLNGHTLEDSLEDGQHHGSYTSGLETIWVMPGAHLTINDSSDLKTGVVDNKENNTAPIYNKEGIVTINGGTIERSLENGESSSSHTNSYYTILNSGVMTINDGAKVLSIITKETETCECEGDCAANGDCECECDGDCACEDGGCDCCKTETSYELSKYSSLIDVGYGSTTDLGDKDISRDTDAELIVNGGVLIGGKRVKSEVLGTLEFNGGVVHGSAGAVKSYGWLTITGGTFISDDDASSAGKNYVINMDNDADSQGVREKREAESQTLTHHNYIRGGTFSFNLPTADNVEPTSLNVRTLEDAGSDGVDYYALAITYSGTDVTENADHLSVSGGTFDGGVYVQDWAHLSISGGTINGNIKEGGIRKVGLNSFTTDGNEYIYNRISSSAHIAGDVDITVVDDSSTVQTGGSNTPLSKEEDLYFRISGGYIDGEIKVTNSRTCGGVTNYKFITGGYFLKSASAVPCIQDGHAVDQSVTYSKDGISGYYHVVSTATTDVSGRVSVPSDSFTFNEGTFDGLSGADNYTHASSSTTYDGIVVTSEVSDCGTIEVVVSGVVANVMSDDQKVAFDASYSGDEKLHFYVAVQIVVHPGETICWQKGDKSGSYKNDGTTDYYDIWIEEIDLGDYAGPTADYGVANFTGDVYYEFKITAEDGTSTSYKVTFKDMLIPKTAYDTSTTDGQS